MIGRLLGRALNRDGQAAALQADALAEGARLAQEAVAAAGQHRRRPPVPHSVLQMAVAQKVLGAWLQNRHQTLYPLALNLRTMDAERVGLLLQVVAAALWASGPPNAAEVDRVSGWLGSVGADSVRRASLPGLLEAPQPLPALLEAVLAARIGPFAYAVALAALDQRQLVNRLFLDYLAARLAIPTDVSRSLAQRYRL